MTTISSPAPGGASARVGALAASVISHGHGASVQALLEQLAALPEPRPAQVLLTLNQPEPALAALAERPWPFALTLIANAQPLGFAANHNQAFARWRTQQLAAGAPTSEADCFAIVNPDVSLRGNPFQGLLAALLARDDHGLAYPQQLDAQGVAQDHRRLLPTPMRLLRRYARKALGRGAQELAPGEPAEWVNAAFCLVRAPAWQAVGGFDTRFHMYAEDVDFCLRLQLAGWTLVAAPDAVVEHAAQRASHRDARHLAWHLRSLWQLWQSQAYARYRARG